MSRIEAGLILFGILFIVIFLVDYLGIKLLYLRRLTGKKKSKKNKKNNELMELSYLIGKFKLDKDKLPIKVLLPIISAINALIISLVAVVVIATNTYIILQFLMGFVLLILLIYALYELLGRFLERRGYTKW